MPRIVKNSPFFISAKAGDGQRLCSIVPGLAGAAQLTIHPYQIVVWVGLTPKGAVSPSTPLPAILDTGLNQNFSACREHLDESGVLTGSSAIPQIGLVRPVAGGQQIPCYQADLWIYCNKPGHRDEFRGCPVRLKLNGGLIVYERDRPDGPRMPLVGLRALVDNGLTLTVDGPKRCVHMSRRWFR